MAKSVEVTKDVLEKLQESLNDRFKESNSNGKKGKRRPKKGKKAKSN